MLLARQSCNAHLRPRDASRVILRAGHEQVASCTAVFEPFQPRLTTLRSEQSWEPELLKQDSDVLLGASGAWTNGLSASAYQQVATQSDASADELLLQGRQCSNSEASSSGSSRSKAGHRQLFQSNAAARLGGTSVTINGSTGVKRSSVVSHAASATATATLVQSAENRSARPGHSGETRMNDSMPGSTTSRAAAAPSNPDKQQQDSRLSVLLQYLEEAAASVPARRPRKKVQQQPRQEMSSTQHGMMHQQRRRPAMGQNSASTWLSDAELTRAVTSAATSSVLNQLYQQHHERMNVIHVGVMLKRLSHFLEMSASGSGEMFKEDELLWSQLRGKATFAMPFAELRNTVDMLSAVQHVAAARERQHSGWVRPRPSPSPAVAQHMLRQHHGQQVQPLQLQQVSTESPAHERQSAASLGQALLNEESLSLPAESLSLATDAEEATDSNVAHINGMAVEASFRSSSSAVFDIGNTSVSRGGDHIGSSSNRNDNAGSVSVGFASAMPLHSSRSLHKSERELVQAALVRSTELMAAGGTPLQELLRLLSAVSRLGFSTGDAWQGAFFQATLSSLPRLGKADLVILSSGVARLQPACNPPAAWLSAFYARCQRMMLLLDAREVSSVLVCASRLPRPYPEGWVEVALQRCTDCLDSFDAPAYGLLLHSLGRMRQRPPRPWVQELLERSTPLLYDFTPEELSLVLRGCCMLRASPGDDWLHEFYALSPSLLRDSSGPQLANMGWALAMQKCRPPQKWVHEWLAQLRRQLHSSCRPLGTARAKWHGIGYAVHAKRAAYAMEAFGVQELELWCRWLRTPMPRPRGVWGSRGWREPPGARFASSLEVEAAAEAAEQHWDGGLQPHSSVDRPHEQ